MLPTTSSSSHIPWNDRLIVYLLDCILDKGCHLNSKKWRETAVLFYSYSAHLKEIYNKSPENGERKIRDKFKLEKEKHSFRNAVGWMPLPAEPNGNNSMLSGNLDGSNDGSITIENNDNDLTAMNGAVSTMGSIHDPNGMNNPNAFASVEQRQIYEKMQIICKQLEEKSMAKDSKREKYEMIKIEKEAIRGIGADFNHSIHEAFGKKRLIDEAFGQGDVDFSDQGKSNKKFKDSLFDERLTEFFKYFDNSGNNERSVEKRMLEVYSEKSISDFILEGSLPDIDSAHDILQVIGLDTIINIYCSPNKKFSPDHFKQEFQELNIHKLVCHKAYMLCEKWRSMLPSVLAESDESKMHTSGVSLGNSGHIGARVRVQSMSPADLANTVNYMPGQAINVMIFFSDKEK